jgi:putative hydrolase of the HAD superfamily
VAQALGERLNLPVEMLLDKTLKILQDHGRGKVFDRLLEELQIDSAKWLRTMVQVYRSHQPLIFLFPGVTAALRSLKDRGVKIGLVTDGLASVQRRKIAALGLDWPMDVIVCTEEIGEGCRKPSTTPFEVALQLLKVPAGAAAYIADDASKDFAGPNRLGMTSVQLRSAGLVGVSQSSLPNDPVYRPKFTAETFDEALELLKLD